MGSSEGSASGRGFLAFRRDVGLVRRAIHQFAEFRRVGQLDFDQPRRAVRIGIDGFRLVLQLAIGCCHFAGHRRINFTDGLDRLHTAQGFPRFQLLAHRGQLHEDYVAQFALRVVGDADRGYAIFDVHPLMFFGVTKICRISHQTTPRGSSSAEALPSLSQIAEPPPLCAGACKTASVRLALSLSGYGLPRKALCRWPPTPEVRKPAQYSCTVLEKANRWSLSQLLRRPRQTPCNRRVQSRAPTFPGRPASASSPPPRLSPAPRGPQIPVCPSCNSGPTRLPIR